MKQSDDQLFKGLDKEVFSVIILAGGRGIRMGGKIPKVLKKLMSKPLIIWVLDLVKNLQISDVVVVTGRHYLNIEKTIRKYYKNGVKFINQSVPLGTGDAVKKGLTKISEKSKYLLVLYGDDSTLYRTSTINQMLNYHVKHGGPVTLLSTEQEGVAQIGGLGIDKNGNIYDVLAKDELEENGVKTTRILCGCFCFTLDWLRKNISRIKKGKLKGEYPLPVLISYAARQGKYAKVQMIDNSEWSSINTPVELMEAEVKKRQSVKKGVIYGRK